MNKTNLSFLPGSEQKEACTKFVNDCSLRHALVHSYALY